MTTPASPFEPHQFDATAAADSQPVDSPGLQLTPTRLTATTQPPSPGSEGSKASKSPGGQADPKAPGEDTVQKTSAEIEDPGGSGGLPPPAAQPQAIAQAPGSNTAMIQGGVDMNSEANGTGETGMTETKGGAENPQKLDAEFEVQNSEINLSSPVIDKPSFTAPSAVGAGAVGNDLAGKEQGALAPETRTEGSTAVALLETPPEEAADDADATPQPPKLGQRLHRALQGSVETSLGRLKQRRTQAFLLGAVATFALGGATSYLLRRPSIGPSSLESALALVPNSAVASLSLNAQTDPWQQLRQLGTPTLQIGLGEWLAVGRDRIVNLGYGDLSTLQQQLAGPPTLALVPTAAAPQQTLPGQPIAATPTDLLLVAPLKNPQAVARELDQRQPPEGFENSVSNHRGIKIWDLQVDLLQRQSVAIFGNFGLLASDRTTLEQAIDSYQNGTALANLNEYEDAQRRLGSSDLTEKDGALLSFYINGPAAVLSNQAAGRLLPLPATLQGLVSQVRLTEADGLAINSITWDQTSGNGLGVLSEAEPALGNKPKAMMALGDRFPASTSFLLSGSSVQAAWRSFSQSQSTTTSLLSPAAIEQQVQSVTSMDLQKDWLSWMDGPYSVGILPIPTQANSRFQTGLTVMAQTSNRRLAERSLQKLDALMVNKYGLTLSTSQLDGEAVVNWANGEGEAVVTHGWLEGNIAFLIVGAPGANLILPQPRATLAASRLYREGMPRENVQRDPAGVLFVDVDRVLDTQLPSLLPLTPASRPVLEQLKSIGVERRPLDERFSRYDLSLQFLARSAAPPAPPAASPQTTDADPLDDSSTDPGSTNPDAIAPASTEPGGVVDGDATSDADAVDPGPTPPPSTPLKKSQESPSPATLPNPSPAPVGSGEMMGPVLPANPPEFGPQLPQPAAQVIEDSNFIEGSNLDVETAIPKVDFSTEESSSNSPELGFIGPAWEEEAKDKAAIAPLETLPVGPTIPDEQPQNTAVPTPWKDVVVDPATENAVSIGPPVPPKGFDFTPVGPKLPLPQAQQWSDSFIQEPVN